MGLSPGGRQASRSAIFRSYSASSISRCVTWASEAAFLAATRLFSVTRALRSNERKEGQLLLWTS